MKKKKREKINQAARQKAHDYCVEWQRRLRLGHWDIATGVLDGDDISEREGHNHFSQYRLESMIGVISPADYPESPFTQDLEQTVVHELLHLWLAPLQAEEGTREMVCLEQAINTIAKTLVEAKYDTQGETTMPSNAIRNPQSPKQKPLANSGIGKGSGKVINPSTGGGTGRAVNPTMPKAK